eukprot:1185332-Prorocentrum_minimum.AAC.4
MENICRGQAPIVDTYWQTETGSFLLTPLPGAHAAKPGAASYPFFGIEPIILDDKGVEQTGQLRPDLGAMATLRRGECDLIAGARRVLRSALLQEALAVDDAHPLR